MNKLEAQAIVESTGNYDEEDVEYVMETYEELMKHIGFEDNRRDNRFIVKFHDIFYYMPSEYAEQNTDQINFLFDDFCQQQYEWIMEALKEKNIDIKEMLKQYCVGHYQVFEVEIPEITKENAVELAMQIYDEVQWHGKDYVNNYIETVNLLQDLEDNYMEYWIEFLEETEDFPKEVINEIKENYNHDKERKK